MRCDNCYRVDAGNTCCPDQTDMFPTAFALLALYAAPYSTKRLRFAAYACLRVERRLGVDILNTPG